MHPRFAAVLATTVASLLIPNTHAAFSDWQDGAVVFRGEPAEVFGPFALFRTEDAAGRRVPLRSLDEAASVRFATELAGAPAASPLAEELRGNVLAIRSRKLVPVDLSNRPAPEVLVVFYCSQNIANAPTMVYNFGRTYERLRAVYGERIELLLCGVQTDAAAHQSFALTTWNPGLITDFRAQRSMPTIMRHAPSEGIRAVALSRSGVQLATSRLGSLAELRRFIDQVTDLLYLLEPNSPATWPDRLHYLNTTRAAAHAHGTAAPLLVGSPLRPEALRRKGVTDVAAQIEVGVDGRPTAVTLAPDCGIPEALRPTISDGLRRGAVFSPALQAGRPVAGTYQFQFILPPAPPCSAADLAWVNGDAAMERPLTHWLVLRPIPVPEQSFSTVDHVDDSDVAVLTPFEVSDERIGPSQQQNCFNSDWFAADGADSIRPVAGAKQSVDGNNLAWDPVVSNAGFVELRSANDNCDYSIGYAWTEIEVEKGTEAWLAIGSDDGLKIWLNGQLVHDRWIRRISLIDDEIVPLRLQAGKNRLLLKIQNAIGDWNFVARLRTR